jgi:hypothetical protein
LNLLASNEQASIIDAGPPPIIVMFCLDKNYAVKYL